MTDLVPNRPTTGVANALDNEVTPAMVEAGIAAVRPREYELWESRTPSELSDFVTAIYLAMRSRESAR